jgi:hypothetical protein
MYNHGLGASPTLVCLVSNGTLRVRVERDIGTARSGLVANGSTLGVRRGEGNICRRGLISSATIRVCVGVVVVVHNNTLLAVGTASVSLSGVDSSLGTARGATGNAQGT